MSKASSIPPFLRIKNDLRRRLRRGEWPVGTAIPPELQLMAEYHVARMTMHRALRELTAEGLLTRTRGAGTFVAPMQAESSLLALRSIHEEMAERGHTHACDILTLESVKADAKLAAAFGLPAGAKLFHSRLLHLENEQPIQLEDRHVNPKLAPDYLAQDFTQTTPSAYLSDVAPLQGATFQVEAESAPAEVARLLRMTAGAPCLVVRRTTRSSAAVASCVTLWHPGDRFRLTGSVER